MVAWQIRGSRAVAVKRAEARAPVILAAMPAAPSQLCHAPLRNSDAAEQGASCKSASPLALSSASKHSPAEQTSLGLNLDETDGGSRYCDRRLRFSTVQRPAYRFATDPFRTLLYGKCGAQSDRFELALVGWQNAMLRLDVAFMPL